MVSIRLFITNEMLLTIRSHIVDHVSLLRQFFNLFWFRDSMKWYFSTKQKCPRDLPNLSGTNSFSFVCTVFLLLIAKYSSGCGVNDETMQWMESIQNAANDDDDGEQSQSESLPATNRDPDITDSNSIYEDDISNPHLKYSRELNYREKERSKRDQWHSDAHGRTRRAARPKEDNKNTCSLYIQTDPLIWRHIREGIVDVSFNRAFDLSYSQKIMV